MEAVNFSLGLAYLAGAGFAFWMWIDALSHHRDLWARIGRNKVNYFIAWYVGGLFTVGLVPIAMSVWYYRDIRPTLR